MKGIRILAVAAAVLASAPAVARGDVTKEPLTFDVLVGANHDEPCVVDANLWTPEGASKANPAPALLVTHGFGGNKNDLDRLARAYSEHGYVVLAYSGLGFGDSGCKITLDDREHDGQAGSQLVSFLGGTKASKEGRTIDYVSSDGPGDPRIGMIGGSYGGQIQFAVAGTDPRVDAIVPIITWNNLVYSLAPNNTDLDGAIFSSPGVVKIDWPLLFFGLGAGGSIASQLSDPSHTGSCPNFADGVCPSLVGGATTGYLAQDEPLLRNASVSAYMKDITIPTFLVQGQSDNLFNLQESVATYKALRAQGTPVKLLWRSSGHSGGGLGQLETNYDDLNAAYESRMQLQWFDYWLKGEGAKPALDFSFITDWLPNDGQDGASSVGVAPAYPAATPLALNLSGTDALVPEAPAAGAASILAVPWAPTSLGGGVLTPSGFDPPGTAAAYSTATLTEPLDLVGVPRLTLHLDAPTFAAGGDPSARLVLFAKLFDVGEDGSANLIRNQISAARVVDPSQLVTIELPGLVHRFDTGHRLRLTVSTSSLTFRSSVGGGPVSIVTDPANPSVLEVPRLNTQTGAVGSAANGLTPFGVSPVALAAASFGAGRCVARGRVVRIRLKARKTLKVARVRVNGRLVKTVTGRALRKKVTVRVPRGGGRVVVRARTKAGVRRRAARTFARCAPLRRP